MDETPLAAILNMETRANAVKHIHPEMLEMIRRRRGVDTARKLWYTTYWKDHDEPKLRKEEQNTSSPQTFHLGVSNPLSHPLSQSTPQIASKDQVTVETPKTARRGSPNHSPFKSGPVNSAATSKKVQQKNERVSETEHAISKDRKAYSVRGNSVSKFKEGNSDMGHNVPKAKKGESETCNIVAQCENGMGNIVTLYLQNSRRIDNNVTENHQKPDTGNNKTQGRIGSSNKSAQDREQSDSKKPTVEDPHRISSYTSKVTYDEGNRNTINSVATAFVNAPNTYNGTSQKSTGNQQLYEMGRAKSCLFSTPKRKIHHHKSREIKSASFYTALARNPNAKAVPATPAFDALTRVLVKAPQWFDDRPASEAYRKRTDIDEWKAQVTKRVPPRPNFAVPCLPPKSTDETPGHLQDSPSALLSIRQLSANPTAPIRKSEKGTKHTEHHQDNKTKDAVLVEKTQQMRTNQIAASNKCALPANQSDRSPDNKTKAVMPLVQIKKLPTTQIAVSKSVNHRRTCKTGAQSVLRPVAVNSWMGAATCTKA